MSRLAGSQPSFGTALRDLDEIVHLLESSLDEADTKMDVEKLAEWAKRRADIQARLQLLELEVMDAIEEEASRRGHAATLAALEGTDPLAVAGIRDKLKRVKKLVCALSASDARRQAMLTRARGIVRAYLSSLFPPAQAYGRAGEARAAAVPASTRTTA